jgi:DNA-binding CsgD family transcriptional regulator
MARPRKSQLTERERYVLSRLAAGLKPGEVAIELGVSRVTISTYLRRARVLLGARTNTEAVAIWAWSEASKVAETSEGEP